MIRVALKGLAGRKLRSALTAFAIVLGVAMVSGTFVLTDTIDQGFDTVFTDAYEQSDLVISPKTGFGERQAGPGGFSAAVLKDVRAVPGVESAAGTVVDEARLIDRGGKVLGAGGMAPMAFGVDSAADPRLNPLKLTAGGWPEGPGEVAIDKAAAEDEGYGVGDAIRVAARGPAREYRIAGIVQLGGAASLGGATVTVFDLATAQQVFDKAGRLDVVRITGAGGVSTDELSRAIRPELPAATQLRTGTAQAQAESGDTSDGLGFLRYFLLAFGGIALFVGSFVIANTLSITIAQRTRELATLRTLGASRRQVLASVIVEALAVGLLASVAGLFAGLGLAQGLSALLAGAGIDLPSSGTVLAGRTILVSLLVGVLITLVASVRPAVRATRVAPIAAVREGATLPPSRLARFGLARLVKPLATVLGWPGARLGGAPGKLARRNAMRNPSRTAATAAALMIGLMLVTFVAILGQGLRTTFVNSVDELFVADYTVTAESGFAPLTPELQAAMARTPGVSVVSGVRSGEAKVDGADIMLSAIDENAARTMAMPWDEGSPAVPAQLGRDGAIVTRVWADQKGLKLGSPVVIETPTGATLRLKVEGIWREPKGGSPFGNLTISHAAHAEGFPNPRNDFTFLEMEGGVSPANTAALERALRTFPDAKLETREQFKDTQVARLAQALNILYVLLGLSVIVSLFGIVNTLVLTVFERTRELGMLRAVGMTRAQVRRMIRHESIVTALLGAALGIGAGVVLAAVATQLLSGQGFTFALPVASLVLFVVAAIVVGVVAAILPARRASHLNVLGALSHE